MRGVRPRSPSACPAPAGPPTPGAPGPAKRRRVQEPAAAEPRPQPGLAAPPAPPPAAALTSVVVLAAGCALRVPLDDVDLLLEPAPTSVLRVALPGHTLLLVPEGLLAAAGQGPSPGGLALAAVLDAAAEDVVVQQGFVCSAPTEMAGQGEACEDDADPDPELLAFGLDPAAGWAAGLWPGAARHSSPGSGFDLDFQLWRPPPGSALQPLPPSPSPGPPEPPGRPQRPPRPACKARRRLFPE